MTDKEHFVEKESAEDKLTSMQQHLVTHVGLSIGIISTIIFVTKTKTFMTPYLKYIIICLIVYSFVLIITGTGEYIEKFVRLQKMSKELSNWDYTISIIYIGLSFLMLSVIILLFVSIIKSKLV
tara:strand:- start:1264 stop:1635 length:372 start_codon:yes stop_codon:yes gene_type:complete